jgi:hypothetical protein
MQEKYFPAVLIRMLRRVCIEEGNHRERITLLSAESDSLYGLVFLQYRIFNRPQYLLISMDNKGG